ncbi:MAG: phosphate signaling complex protein PhoU [Candidatus Aminicenantes bacterium]|jgi:phosphate transport system protein
MERHFEAELKELREKLLHMAALTEETITLAVTGLKDRDEGTANKVFEEEKKINVLDVEIDQLCMELLALKQPMAKDLRFITSINRIGSELERIADQSVNIAERTLQLLKLPALKPLIDIPRMAGLAQEMVRDSITAFVNRDANLAVEVCKRDDEVDDLNDQIFRELLTYMMQDAKNIERALDLILVGRHLERIADHATNISEDVIYLVKGKSIKHHCETREFSKLLSDS